MVSTACPIDAKDFSSRPTVLQSFSVAPHEATTRGGFQRCSSGLTHGLQMDLQQAVQLEKQDLEKMGLLPQPAEVEMALAAIMLSDDEVSRMQLCASPPDWLYRQPRAAAPRVRGHCGDCLPYSPPVPIPQHHHGLPSGLSHAVHADELEFMGTSQGEAEGSDQVWNYSLESRESMEAATGGLNREHAVDGAAWMDPHKHSKLQSPASLGAYGVDEDNEDGGNSRDPHEEELVRQYGYVFEMEDL